MDINNPIDINFINSLNIIYNNDNNNGINYNTIHDAVVNSGINMNEIDNLDYETIFQNLANNNSNSPLRLVDVVDVPGVNDSDGVTNLPRSLRLVDVPGVNDSDGVTNIHRSLRGYSIYDLPGTNDDLPVRRNLIDEFRAAAEEVEVFYAIPSNEENTEDEISETESIMRPDTNIDMTVPKCSICLENNSAVVFNCGHMCSCNACSQRVDTCPICRARIVRRQNVFM